MSREDSNKGRKASGRQGGNFKKKSYARGNAPIKKTTTPKQASDPNSIRLNKYVANSGVCSRRDADIYIAAGNITVNGKPITEMGYKVKVSFKGQNYVLFDAISEKNIARGTLKG